MTATEAICNGGPCQGTVVKADSHGMFSFTVVQSYQTDTQKAMGERIGTTPPAPMCVLPGAAMHRAVYVLQWWKPVEGNPFPMYVYSRDF